MKFRILASSGINLSNVPSEFFDLTTNVEPLNNGDTIVYTNESTVQMQDCLRTTGISFSIDHSTSEVGVLVVGPPRTMGALIAPVAAPVPFIAPEYQQQVIRDVANYPIRRHEADDDIDDLSDSDGYVRSVTNQHFSPGAMLPFENDESKLLMAQQMQNEITSSASLISAKMVEYNRLVSVMARTRNEINALMRPIKTNDIINNLVEAAKKLQFTYEVIESVSVVKGPVPKLVVFTKHINTDVVADGTTRSVGKMAIAFNLQAMLCEKSAGNAYNSDEGLLKIFNQTSIATKGDDTFQCGHVNGEGKPCFGNIDEDIYNAFVSHDISLVVELVIKFIKNPDIHDAWGCGILAFPIVSGGIN